MSLSPPAASSSLRVFSTRPVVNLEFRSHDGKHKEDVPAYAGLSIYYAATNAEVRGFLGSHLFPPLRHPLVVFKSSSPSLDASGICEGKTKCSTCHVILPKSVYDKLPPPSEMELDLLVYNMSFV